MTPFMLNKSQKNTACSLWIQMHVCKFITKSSKGVYTNLVTVRMPLWGEGLGLGVLVRGPSDVKPQKTLENGMQTKKNARQTFTFQNKVKNEDLEFLSFKL